MLRGIGSGFSHAMLHFNDKNATTSKIGMAFQMAFQVAFQVAFWVSFWMSFGRHFLELLWVRVMNPFWGEFS